VSFDAPFLVGVIVVFFVPEDDFGSLATSAFNVENEVGEVFNMDESMRINDPSLVGGV